MHIFKKQIVASQISTDVQQNYSSIVDEAKTVKTSSIASTKQ